MPESIDTPATPDAIFGKDAIMQHSPITRPFKASQQFITDAKWDHGELTPDGRAGDDHAERCARPRRPRATTSSKDLTSVDWYPAEPRFQLSYSLLSHRLKQRIRIVARLEGDTPTIDSITGVWPAANFYEREVFDLFGVDFPGHPRLTRIMMPTDWVGHPLRKDYPVEGYR